MVATGPLGDAARLPPRLAVHPELTDDDVAWLNEQLTLVDRPAVRYARALPLPPLSSGLAPRPTPDTSWIKTERVIG